jgi:predicted transcriptional regulator
MSRGLKREPFSLLGALEHDVLEHLWATGDAEVTAVHGAVGAPRGITLNTVGSALERLHRKGLVERWKMGHAYCYRASVSREVFHARRMVEAAGGAAALADTRLLAAFVDAMATADSSTLAQLESVLRERRKKP